MKKYIPLFEDTDFTDRLVKKAISAIDKVLSSDKGHYYIPLTVFDDSIDRNLNPAFFSYEKLRELGLSDDAFINDRDPHFLSLANEKDEKIHDSLYKKLEKTKNDFLKGIENHYKKNWVVEFSSGFVPDSVSSEHLDIKGKTPVYVELKKKKTGKSQRKD
jgi:hypothetical protein